MAAALNLWVSSKGAQLRVRKIVTQTCASLLHEFLCYGNVQDRVFFGSLSGTHDVFQGRHGCADENEVTGLSQTSGSAASWLHLEIPSVTPFRVATFGRRTLPFPQKAKRDAHRTQIKRYVEPSWPPRPEQSYLGSLQAVLFFWPLACAGQCLLDLTSWLRSIAETESHTCMVDDCFWKRGVLCERKEDTECRDSQYQQVTCIDEDGSFFLDAFR